MFSIKIPENVGMKIFGSKRKKIQKIAIIYSSLRFIHYFNLFWLIQNVYFLDNGITYFQLSIILGAYAFFKVICEVPSGILADKFGRKSVIIIAKISFLAGLLFFIINPNFVNFLIGIFCWGIHESFMSGAQESLLYDYLKKKKASRLFNKIFALSTIAREVGLGLGALISGLIAQVDIKYNLFGSIVIATVGLFLSFGLKDTKSYEQSEESKFFYFLKKSYSDIKKSVSLKKILIFSITVIVAYDIIAEYIVVGLRHFEIPFYLIGLAAIPEALFFIIGSYLSQKVSLKIKNKVYILVSLFMTILLLMLTIQNIYVFAIGILMLSSLKSFSDIYSMNDWQSNVSSRNRATITSINSLSMSLVYIVTVFIFGKISNTYGLFNSFFIVATLAFLFTLLNAFSKKSKKA